MVTSDDDIRQLRRPIDDPAAFRSVFERHHSAVRRYLHQAPPPSRFSVGENPMLNYT